MMKLINIISNYVATKNAKLEKSASLNLLDIGCSSFIPKHLRRHPKLINYFGCDPDVVGLEKVKEKNYISKFISSKFLNVGASNETKSSFLKIGSKRTGSKTVSTNKNKNHLTAINLLQTSELQQKFKSGNANIVKIDAEGHELQIIKGMNLTCKDLICVEVECTLDQENNNLSSIFTLFETNNFFLASLKYHHQQTFTSNKFKNKLSKLLYKFLIRLPIIGRFNFIWTNLSGSSSFNENKGFLEQIELVFLKQKRYIGKNNYMKYSNLLLIYGFLRHIPDLKISQINKFIINNFPSR